mmetsp:Transcript_5519/g.9405  ORF Transcript_5519/g.9405 Transcript_5519/m.9405 type:complete len:134 (+) Transcript_5519:2186-2587(+)
MPNPEHKKMTAMHFYAWEKGLKTGQYYLRSRPARDAIKFTVNMEALIQAAENKDEGAILNALDKVDHSAEPKDQKADAVQIQKSVNLGRKSSQPRGGFTEGNNAESKLKNQKTREEEADEEDFDPFTCENCGS